MGARSTAAAFLFLLLSTFYVPFAAAASLGNTAQAVNSYSQVIFDERGLALVLNRLEFLNLKTETVKDLTLEIPGNNVEMKYALEGLIGCQQTCAQYENTCVNNRKVCQTWDYGANSCTNWIDECQQYSKTCVRYQESCSNYGNYYDSSTSFKLLDFEKIGANTFKLKLDKPIESGRRAIILISYRSLGHVTERIAKDFDFPTIKYPFDVDYTRVAVTVDKSLLLKGGSTSTDYTRSYATFEGALAVQSKSASISSSSISYAQNVKSAQGLVKEKSNLLPYEVFHVTGSYSESSWKLYLFDWLFWIAIVLILGFLVVKFGFSKINEAIDSIAPSPKDRKAAAPDFMRAAISGIVFSIMFSVACGFMLLIFTVVGFGHAGLSSSDPFNAYKLLILAMILLGILSGIAVFLFIASRFTAPEGAVAAIVFLGISIILAPITLVIFGMLISVFQIGAQRYY
ncbi:MAG: hypothetical protein V1835_03340 [Candidatus Micrarchaeota archaeon]